MSKCPKCGSEYFEVREDDTCLSCGWQRKTVFARITESPETLAGNFVYQIMDDSGEILFFSTIANVYCSGWQKYEDAYEWTLAKLKEVKK